MGAGYWSLCLAIYESSTAGVGRALPWRQIYVDLNLLLLHINPFRQLLYLHLFLHLQQASAQTMADFTRPRFTEAIMHLSSHRFLMTHHGFSQFVSYPARALRAQGLLLADGAPTVGGGRLFEPSAGFFYGNSCNFETKSQKIVSKVGN